MIEFTTRHGTHVAVNTAMISTVATNASGEMDYTTITMSNGTFVYATESYTEVLHRIDGRTGQ